MNHSLLKTLRIIVSSAGKKIGGNIYLHKNYAAKVVPEDVWLKVLKVLKKADPDFPYTVVKWAPKENKVSFIESTDFDTADEPTVGRSMVVTPDGYAKLFNPPSDPWIYHHKWMFVDPSYTGFDVAESKRRSKSWEDLPNVDKTRIGKKSYWETKVLPLLD